MYADPKHKRVFPIKARYTAEERKLIDAVAEFRGKQPADLIHKISMEVIAKIEADLPDEIKRQHGIF